MMIQLNPTIPMMTPKGSGYALFVVDYSQEHHLMWVVALDDGGQIWMFENPDVRVQANVTLGRRPDRGFVAGAPHPVASHPTGSNGANVNGANGNGMAVFAPFLNGTHGSNGAATHGPSS